MCVVSGLMLVTLVITRKKSLKHSESKYLKLQKLIFYIFSIKLSEEWNKTCCLSAVLVHFISLLGCILAKIYSLIGAMGIYS